MRRIAFLYSVVTWIVTVTLILMSHNSNPYIFNILLDIVITFLGLIIGINYLKGFSSNYFSEGLFLGILIFMVNIILDQVYYNFVGLPMGIVEYILNVGFIYLVYIIIIGTLGFLFDHYNTIIKGEMD